MSIVIGGPKKPEKDERPSFYIHKKLLCYLDVQPDGVYVEGKTPEGNMLFRKHFPHSAVAMAYIEALRKEWNDGTDEREDDKNG